MTIGDGTNSASLLLSGNIGTGGDLTVKNNAILEQDNKAQQEISGTLTIESGGTFTHDTNITTFTAEIDFKAADMVIAGTVNANSLGYKGGTSRSGNGSGSGPNGGSSGKYLTVHYRGYGGGNACNSIGSGGGGGTYGSNSSLNRTGGTGGGFIQLEATGDITITGTITATGGNGSSNAFTGGGAGGAINIVADRVLGTPSSITVYRGSRGKSPAGHGNGGCIDIQYYGRSIVTSTADSVLVGHSSINVERTGVQHEDFPIANGSTNPKLEGDLTSVSNYKLANVNGFVQWQNGVNIDGINFDKRLKIGDGFVSLDASNVHSSLDTQATVSLDIDSCLDYTIYYASSFYSTKQDIIDNGQECNTGTNPACTNISCTDNVLTFTVPHFDGFGVEGGGGGGGAGVPEFGTFASVVVILVGGYYVIRQTTLSDPLS